MTLSPIPSSLCESFPEACTAWARLFAAGPGGASNPTDAGHRVRALRLLRDFAFSIHADRSRALASGRASQISVWAEVERRLEHWTRAALPAQLPSTLPAFLAGDLTQEPIAPLPDALLTLLGGADRLARPDRRWERALASEAARLGWRFWAAEGYVPIEKADPIHKGLGRELGGSLDRVSTSGVLLFAEAYAASNHHRPGQWHGRWIAALPPQAGEMPLPAEAAGILTARTLYPA